MDTKKLIEQAYAAFNSRNVDSALNLMAENVSWPKASEGGRVVGRDEIRSYWSRQWETFDPRVYVLEIEDVGNGRANVKVHQLVKDLDGNVLSDTEVWHEYTIKDGLIERMDIREDENNSGGGQSAAFAKHSNQ
ncbi:MAG TPA: nuclear transport factor 2 family protein [Oculatellaceae cyanobacterium]